MKIDFENFEKGTRKLGANIKDWAQIDSYKKLLDEVKFTTRADVDAHQSLLDLIQSHSECKTVLSEEDYEIGHQNESYWLIDPIDGTASWHGGYDGYVTQACYLEKGKVLYAVVYAPALEILWTAQCGKGAYMNGRRLPKVKARKANEMVVVDNYPEPKHVAKEVYEKLELSNYLESGSIGLKSCLVASGDADIFVKDVIVRDWDVAPADLINSECGAIMTDLKGDRFSYSNSPEKNEGLLVASDEDVAELVLNSIQTK